MLDVIELLGNIGVELFDWQQVLLEAWLGVDQRGKWSAGTCGNETPRQNGKTLVIAGRMLAEALFYGGKSIYTAQSQKTSTETFEELAAICDCKAMRGYLAKGGIRTALGRERIDFKSGATIKFLARTRSGGNGQHGSLLVFDEAQYLDESAQGSFLPAISATKTARGPQTIYNGNAPEEGDYGLVFEGIRSKALSGGTKTMAWTEWSVDSQTIPPKDSPALWERVNPSLGVLIDRNTVQIESEVLEDEQFAHQRLGWFKPRTTEQEQIEYLITDKAWDVQEVEKAPTTGRIAYGVKFSTDGLLVHLAACAANGEMYHVEHIRTESTMVGIQWLVDWLLPRLGGSVGVAIDGKAGAADLAIALIADRAPKNAVKICTTNDVLTAVASFVNGVYDKRVTHAPDEHLREVMTTATRRRIGKAGGYGFGGENGELCEAVSLAMWRARTSKRDPNRGGEVY